MEEDIKNVEYAIKHFNGRFKDCLSIANLLTRYKELEEENKKLKEITNTYNAFGNDYISNETKMIIADREYFNNGIFKESFVPKSLIKEKIKELENMSKDGLYVSRGHITSKIQVLQELLEEEK